MDTYALEVLTKLVIEVVSDNLGVLAVLDVLLSVQEPVGDLVLTGVLKDNDNTLELFVGKLSSTMLKNKSVTLASRDLANRLRGKTYRLLRSMSAFLQTMLA